MTDGGRDLRREIHAALQDDSLQAAVPKATRLVAMMRRRAVERFAGYEAARRRAREIKEDAIERLPELLDRLRESVCAAGGRVHDAADAAAARRILVKIAREEGCRAAVKSKSMTSEEVDLNPALEEAGITVRETDLGEYIAQLAGDRPSHIIAPIIHMGLEDVRDVFRQALDLEEVPESPEGLTQLARSVLRAQFLEADMGITGANFVLADTGAVVLVENEGNIRLCTQLPRVHVALLGVEKVLPSLAELEPFLELLPRSATGQLLATYVSILGGPGWGASPLVDGPRRFHLVLLDNGRMAMRDDPDLREALYCIRCGACLNVCPPYQAVGGHVYGGPTYQSGIGNAWEAGVSGLDVAAGFNALCTTCSRCRDVCPVRIDIPWMNAAIRRRARERDEGRPLATSLLEEPGRLYRLARRAGPLRGLAGVPPVRWLLERRLGLDRRRELPELPPETLSSWFEARGGRVVRPGEAVARGRGAGVCLWVDCHTENLDVDVGRAAVEVLEAMGLRVFLATGPCCGRAAVSQGNLAEAERQARQTQRLLAPILEAGLPVVAVEPSCASCVTEDHRRLLPAGARPATSVLREILVFLEERMDGVTQAVRESEPRDRTVLVHGHCQQKTAGWFERGLALLAALPGVRVHATHAECCGMAGSFGYKPDSYELSMELGRRLGEEIDAIDEADGTRSEVLACGTSCRTQLREAGGREARHPVQLLAELVREKARGSRDRAG